jgi:putative nucleotidyltransferase with HDIG domain
MPSRETAAARIAELLPEINDIRDAGLREQVVGCWLDALDGGGWSADDLLSMPASLRLTDRPFGLIEHVRGVAQMAQAACRVFGVLYGEGAIRVDPDVVLAGALLHDVGKPLEFARGDGAWRLSEQARFFRHPFGGFAIASWRKLPPAVLEIIAYHSTEGETFPRSAEGMVIHLADALNFAPFFAGRS